MLALPITVSNTLKLLWVADPSYRRTNTSLSNMIFFIFLFMPQAICWFENYGAKSAIRLFKYMLTSISVQQGRNAI